MDTNLLSTTTPESGSDDVQSRLEAIIGGETAEIEETPTPTEESTEEQSGEESEETTETDQADTDEETEESEDQDEEAAEEDETGEEIELEIGYFAQAFGAEENQFTVSEDGELLIKTKVDGVEKPLPLGDLVKSYQTDAHVTQKSQRLSQQLQEDRTEFETLRETETKRLHEAVTETAALTQQMEQQLIGDFNSPQLQALKTTDPGAYSAKVLELQQRAQYIQQAKQKVGQAISEQQTKTNQEQTEKRQQKIQEETQTLLTKVPEWNDPAVASKEIGDLQDFLINSFGFTEDEVTNLGDHRLVLLARAASKGSTISKTTEEAVRKVRAKPKIVKPGPKAAEKSVKQRQKADQKRVKLKKTGSTKDLADVLLDRI